jgi:hypothetical protein
MFKAVLLAITFAVSFAIMFLGIIIAIHFETWLGLMVSFGGLVSFWRFLPEVNYE